MIAVSLGSMKFWFWLVSLCLFCVGFWHLPIQFRCRVVLIMMIFVLLRCDGVSSDMNGMHVNFAEWRLQESHLPYVGIVVMNRPGIMEDVVRENRSDVLALNIKFVDHAARCHYMRLCPVAIVRSVFTSKFNCPAAIRDTGFDLHEFANSEPVIFSGFLGSELIFRGCSKFNFVWR